MVDQIVRQGNVIEMAPFLSQNRFTELAEIDAYWTAIKGAQLVPERAQLNPRGIDGALAYSFLLEREGARRFRLRIAGRYLMDLLQEECRGLPLHRMFCEADHANIDALAEQVCSEPGLAQMSILAERGRGKPNLEGRMKLWPLRDRAGAITQILGGVSCKGVVGDHARRFLMVSSRFVPITAPADALHAVGFAEPATSFAGEGSDKPRLRLIKT